VVAGQLEGEEPVEVAGRRRRGVGEQDRSVAGPVQLRPIEVWVRAVPRKALTLIFQPDVG